MSEPRSGDGRRRASAAIVPILMLATAALAGTRSHVESAEDLARGRATGMAVTRAGRLFLAPRVTLVGRPDATHVWSIAAGAAGEVYFGTGPEGLISRLAARRVLEVAAALPAPLVTALAPSADGALLAASAPEGTIRRVLPDGSVHAWAALGERYVWALARTEGGRLFAGTGERGQVVEILPSGETETFFDSDEPHIVSLASLPGGDLLAGGAGRGLVYRIDPEGHAFVLHDDDLPEASALAATPDGNVYVALVAPPAPDDRRPSLSLRLPDGARVGSSGGGLDALEQDEGPTVRGVIEGLAEEPPREPYRLRGRVVRIGPGEEAAEIWRSRTEAPFALALDAAGRLHIGTGEPARVWRVEPDGDVALLVTLDEAQATRLLSAADALYVGTSNPAAVHRIEDRAATDGVFDSRPFDASSLARWGAIRWQAKGPIGRVEVTTRTGNSAEPDASWSAWGPVMTDPAAGAIVNPDGRFLQWRLHQIGAADAGGSIERVVIDYEPYNRAPSVTALAVAGAGAVATAARVTWTTRDPDGDPLEVEVSHRRVDRPDWAVSGRSAVPGSEPDEQVPGSFDWATADLEEGTYTLRAAASDQPGRPPGEGRSSAASLETWLTIDRTPPRIAWQATAGGAIEVLVEDSHSAIRGLEILDRGRLRFTARPIDGVSDSPAERYRLELPGEAGAQWVLRGVDAAGNAAEAALGPV